MKIRSLMVVLTCSLLACGGRLASETSPPPAGTTSPPPGGTSPTVPPVGTSPTGTPIGIPPAPPDTSSDGGGPACSGDEAMLIHDCPTCGFTGYALCDGTSYTECSCSLPAGWTLVDEGDDAGSGDDGSPVSAPGIERIQANANGYVAVGTNSVGVSGSWYVYGDGWGTEGYDGGTGASGERGTCELLGGFPVSDCSTITSPLPPAPFVAGADAGIPPGYANGFPPVASSQTFCLSGTGAKVIAQDGGTGPDYGDIYGIGMGFDFNNIDGVKSSYDASAYNVVGVQFTLASRGAFPPMLRVEFPTTDTDSAGGTNDPYALLPTGPGMYTVYWTTLETPYPPVAGENIGYSPPAGTMQPEFNPSHLLSIQFHVPTDTTATIPVNHLCVSNLSALVAPVPR